MRRRQWTGVAACVSASALVLGLGSLVLVDHSMGGSNPTAKAPSTTPPGSLPEVETDAGSGTVDGVRAARTMPQAAAPESVAEGVPANTNQADTSDDERATAAAPRGSGPIETGLTGMTGGAEAVDELGDALPDVAARVGLPAEGLEGLLRSDETVQVSPEGKIAYFESIPTAPAPAVGVVAPAPLFPLDQTFELHSRPGSLHTIYLDFDGVTVSATNDWANYAEVPVGTYRGWDPARNGDAFDDAERASVQEIWARIAEDYAPFDVNVTTKDPGQDALAMQGPADTRFGTRVAFTSAPEPAEVICESECAGVAWLGVIDADVAYFGGETDVNEIAWVFPGVLDDSAAAMAEAASHEAGHTIGLVHDGDSQEGDGYFVPYYGNGVRVWAPIMGASYYAAVSQWSKGEYTGATNWGQTQTGPVRIELQDDIAIIREVFGARPVTASAGSTRLEVTGETRHIAAASQVDTYRLGSCGVGAQVQVQTAQVGPNLDAVLTVVDSSGRLVGGTKATNPLTSQTWQAAPETWVPYRAVVARGTGATIDLPNAGGPYFAQVEGGGNLDGRWADGGYGPYGSLGAYTLSATGCDTSPTAPSTPQGVTHSVVDGTVKINWLVPFGDGGAPITGFEVTVGTKKSTLAATARSWSGAMPVGSHRVSVNAINSLGAGTAALRTATVAAPPRIKPSAPSAAIKAGKKGGKKTVIASWVAGRAGTSPITQYKVTVYRTVKPAKKGKVATTKIFKTYVVGASGRKVEKTLAAKKGTTYSVAVQAKSVVGWSPMSRRTKAIAPR